MLQREIHPPTAVLEPEAHRMDTCSRRPGLTEASTLSGLRTEQGGVSILAIDNDGYLGRRTACSSIHGWTVQKSSRRSCRLFRYRQHHLIDANKICSVQIDERLAPHG